MTNGRCSACVFSLLAVMLCLIGGCVRHPYLVPGDQQVVIDRKLVEYPTGFELRPYVTNLTGPTAIAFDIEGSLLIAEGGMDGSEPRVSGFKADGKRFNIYPPDRKVPLYFVQGGFRMYGPIGGMIVHQGRIFISHRDSSGMGVITALDYEGHPTTIVADLPAQGDYGVTDLAIAPNGRLYFGVGTATNSGVVGIDNWSVGWVLKNPKVADLPYVNLKLLGYRFDTPNPLATLFGGADIAVTAPFQPFGTSNQTRVRKAPNDKPNGAVYSVSPTGGDLRVEAHGIRYPRGLAFNEYGRLYVTNDGMELRGTRPVKDDPDTLLRMVSGAWYGWPDFSADLLPITEERFQPPQDLIIKTGYPDLGFLIDHETSGLLRPDRNTLLAATFQPLSGAAKLDFVPASGPFKEFRGSAIVALSGDRAPFATSGQKLVGPTGYKVVRVDVDGKQVKDFVRNTDGVPASRISFENDDDTALERPIDVKFGPDGAMYILDLGVLESRNGETNIRAGTGKIFRLAGMSEQPQAPTSRPAPRTAEP